MRASTFLLLIGSLALFQGACSSKKETPPPPIKKDLVVGKWKIPTGAPFLVGYEFGEDGSLKMTVQGLKQPIKGRYTWSDERSMEVEYLMEGDVREAYETAAQAYKKRIRDQVEKQIMDSKMASGLLVSTMENLPDKETFRVGITDPRYLVLVRGNTSLNFERAD
jgi:hypothetical protein